MFYVCKKSTIASLLLIGLSLLFLSPSRVLAQEDRIKVLEEKIQMLMKEVEAIKAEQARRHTDAEHVQILMEEVEALKEKDAEEFDLAEKIHFHGYGELHYKNTSEEGQNDKMDFHRMVIGLGYRFNDWIVFDTEVDFEHATSEMELEYAHLSFLLSDAFNVRMGSMLMPVGYLNEFHEPPLFYSVERPYVQTNVIPTTWQEGGAGIFGSPYPDLNYRLYLVGGLDASNFTASSGIRSGRGKVQNAKADDLAVVGRLEYGGISGVDLGFSGYLGDAAQGNSSLGDATVSILEGDIRYRWKDLELTGLVASVNVDDTDRINTVTGQVIGENILGWYLEGAYHLGRSFLPEGQDIVLFARHEQFDTQEDVSASLTADPANDREVTTVGLAYYPIPQVAVKADLETWENGAGSDWHQVNLGISFMY